MSTHAVAATDPHPRAHGLRPTGCPETSAVKTLPGYHSAISNQQSAFSNPQFFSLLPVFSLMEIPVN
ncbi:MAG: hypothetical protein GYA20_12025 [Chloroflexi bacterium]|nr:hypothetical protein [Chloroflexota bacterium]